MGYSVNIVKDSIGPNGIRLITMLLRYNRFIHAEMLRHRMFSHSVKSSRAKPTRSYRKEVYLDPSKPIFWGANKKGMQSKNEEIKYKWVAEFLWDLSRHFELCINWCFEKLNLHKQIANRRIECDLMVDHLVTGTEEAFFNFYALRCHGDAQPEIQKIARMMVREHRESIPELLFAGDWHLPFIDKTSFDTDVLCKISAARCARLSYFSFITNKIPSLIEDLNLFDKLIGGDIKHASPCEHQAQACEYDEFPSVNISGNLYGWKQFRKMIPCEVQRKFDLWSINQSDYNF